MVLTKKVNGVEVDLSAKEEAEIKKDWKNNQSISKAEEHRAKRLSKYPPIGEQLDMIYWDKVNRTNLWPQIIGRIKAAYPKPE